MRKQIKPNLEIGDVNYVKPGEFFVTLSDDGKTPTSVQRRKGNLDMETILGQGGGSNIDNVITLTAEELEQLKRDNPVYLPNVTSEWLNNVVENVGTIVINDGEPKNIWDDATRSAFAHIFGNEMPPDMIEVIFGPSFMYEENSDTFAIVNIPKKSGVEVGFYIVKVPGGFVPYPVLNFNIDDLNSVIGNGVVTPGTPVAIPDQYYWVQNVLDGHIDYEGIVELVGGKVLPRYSDTVERAFFAKVKGHREWVSDEFLSDLDNLENIFLFGKANASSATADSTVVENGPQLAIYICESAPKVPKIALISGWKDLYKDIAI